MPSRADGDVRGGVRVWLERGAHALALTIIVWLLIESLHGGEDGDTRVVGVGALPEALERWSTVAAPRGVHLRVDSALSPAQRDWLAALRGAGAHVTWEGDGVVPVAAVADPVADPAGGTRIWAAAPAGATVVLADRFGVLDSVRTGFAGARFLAHSPLDDVRVRAGPLVALGAPRDSLTFARILVVGRVGWESKFVAAALEERGWRVDARLALSPKGDVVQGTASAIDTANYAAVIVLDTAGLAGGSSLVGYVRSGGGLIVHAGRSSAPFLAPLRVGAAGRLVDAVEPFDSKSAEPRRALALTPITLGPEAVALEQRDALVTIAARRVERGRVAMVGYDDTWRWRMGGGDDALEEHRTWWAGLVASVAHVGRETRTSDWPVDEAPLVSLVDQLGPSRPALHGPARRGSIPHALLLGIFGTVLVLEWLSRRLRGAP